MEYSDDTENKNHSGIKKFVNQDGLGVPNAFLEKKDAELDQSHRAWAKRNNLFSENKVPIECEKCHGDLAGIDAGRYRCLSCGHINRDSIRKIRDFSEENGPQPALVIARATGVDRRTVEYFLLDEHLEIPAWSEVTISCQNCGAKIRTGRLCDNCKRQTKRKDATKNKNGLMYTRRKEAK